MHAQKISLFLQLIEMKLDSNKVFPTGNSLARHISLFVSSACDTVRGSIWDLKVSSVLSYHSSHSQSKLGFFGPKKKVSSVKVLIGIVVDIYKKCLSFHSEAPATKSYLYHLLIFP